VLFSLAWQLRILDERKSNTLRLSWNIVLKSPEAHLFWTEKSNKTTTVKNKTNPFWMITFHWNHLPSPLCVDLYVVRHEINVSTECLKWRLTFWQMQERTLRQTVHACVASETHKIKSSDWLKWHCAIWPYEIFCLYRTKCHFRWSDKRDVDTSVVFSLDRWHVFVL